ncbi:MAG: hypothetical protein R3F17_10790 [Planctomycetota bacterium]
MDFEIPRFVQDVGRTLDQFGRCVVAVSEGIHNAKGELIQASTEVDSHGNPLLAGGALGDQLAEVIKRELGVSRVRADTFGYLQRSYFGVVSEVDAREARAVGRHAVELALAGHDPHGSVIIRRESTRPHEASLGCTDLENVAQKTRCMPAEFLAGTNGVSSRIRRVAGPAGRRLAAPRTPLRSAGAPSPGLIPGPSILPASRSHRGGSLAFTRPLRTPRREIPGPVVSWGSAPPARPNLNPGLPC